MRKVQLSFYFKFPDHHRSFPELSSSLYLVSARREWGEEGPDWLGQVSRRKEGGGEDGVGEDPGWPGGWRGREAGGCPG